jgi:hypothetical protein
MQCPRCRKGNMFVQKNSFANLRLSKFLAMPQQCSICAQPFELETGFWYGTGYVSYALTFAIAVASFIAWWVLLGFSLYDNSLFYWLGTTIFLIFALTPWVMRISRVIYLYFFVRYNKNYKTEAPHNWLK